MVENHYPLYRNKHTPLTEIGGQNKFIFDKVQDNYLKKRIKMVNLITLKFPFCRKSPSVLLITLN